MMGVWGDLKAEAYIQSIIQEKLKNSSGTLHRIWSNFPNKIPQILQMSFMKVYTSAVTAIKKINNEANQNMISSKSMLTTINISNKSEAGSNKSLKVFKDDREKKQEETKGETNKNIRNVNEQAILDENEMIQLLPDEQKKFLYKIGCTVNIAGNKMINQNYKFCITCKNILKNDVKVCIP